MPSEIPSGWKLTTVGKVINRHFCGPSPDCEERVIAADHEWGVLKTTAITWDGWNELAHKTLPPQYWGMRDIAVEQGDVLVTKAGPRERVAVVTHVTTSPKRLIVSGKMIALRPSKKSILPRILSGILSLSGPQKYLQDRTTGMAESQVNFPNEALLQTPVVIPPSVEDCGEQVAIAAILDGVDESIRKTEQVLAKLKQIKAGLMHDLLTVGLDERGQLRDPLRHPELFQPTLLGRLPMAWDVEPCRNICREIVVGIVVKPAQLYCPNGVPVLRSTNVRESGVDLSDIVFMSEKSNQAHAKSILKKIPFMFLFQKEKKSFHVRICLYALSNLHVLYCSCLIL